MSNMMVLLMKLKGKVANNILQDAQKKGSTNMNGMLWKQVRYQKILFVVIFNIKYHYCQTPDSIKQAFSFLCFLHLPYHMFS